MPSPSRELLTEGAFLGGYRIMDLLSTGRFWDIYLARAASTQRVVVLKVVHEDVPEERVRRFLVKTDHLTGLEHPHIARIFEAGRDGGFAFFAQEHIEGPRGRALSVAEEQRNHGGCLPEDTVRLRSRQLWEGLRAAHAYRGEGSHWGGHALEHALLTPQHRVKLLAPSLRNILEGGDGIGTDGVATDVRAFGDFLHTALTGCPPGAQAPSELGAPKAWDRVVADCRQASTTKLPDDLEVSDALMTAGAPSGKIKWLVPAFLLIALAALVPVVMALRAIGRPSKEEVAALAVAEKQAQTEQAVSDLLVKAEAALARMEFGEAKQLVDEALALDPEHARARLVEADIQTAEGLARVGSVKTAAEEAWAKVRDLPAGPGVGERLAAGKLALDRARLALSGNRFDEAKDGFETVARLAAEVQDLDAARDEAVVAQGRCMVARTNASDENAAEFAPDTWRQAASADDTAKAAWEKGDFAAAGTQWLAAEELYGKADAEAKGRQEAQLAKDAFSREVTDAREASVRLPRAAIEEAQKADAHARELLADGQWGDAASAWRQAAQELASVRAKATATQQQQNYASAMAEGGKWLAAKDYAKAEAAFARALAEPGRGADPEAMSLYEKSRQARIALASKRAWQGKDGNLVRNGDFEADDEGVLVGWTKPDNLTVYWEDCGVSGKGLRLDTDVYRSEWEEHRKNPDEPMVKTKTSGTKYNTVGGTTGVAVYSRPIPVEPDGYYAIEYDVRGKGEPFLFIKGFWKCSPQDLHLMGKKMFFKPFKPGASYSLMAMGTSGEEKRDAHPGDYIQCFRQRLVARVGNPNEWRHFKTVVHFEPERRVEVVLLELYAYWPPGEYFFDNVRMTKVTKAEAEAHEAWRQKLGEAANKGTLVKP